MPANRFQKEYQMEKLKMEFTIKNMVCDRCIMVVSQIFNKAGVPVKLIELGKVETEKELTPEQINYLGQELVRAGFEIINTPTARLVEEIKTITIEYVYSNQEKGKVNFSTWLTSKVHKDYSYLSNLFSTVAGMTIEQYLIRLKIERVKELLVYDEKTVGEIALELGYSSSAHLSGQFKKITGFTPTYFKNLKEQKRKTINNL